MNRRGGGGVEGQSWGAVSNAGIVVSSGRAYTNTLNKMIAWNMQRKVDAGAESEEKYVSIDLIGDVIPANDGIVPDVGYIVENRVDLHI